MFPWVLVTMHQWWGDESLQANHICLLCILNFFQTEAATIPFQWKDPDWILLTLPETYSSLHADF